MVEYDALVNHVTMWNVAVERQIRVQGPDAEAFVDFVITRDATKIPPMRARYVILCNEQGGILNDPVLLRLSDDEFWFSLSDSDLMLWLQGVNVGKRFDVAIEEIDVCPVQIQGPKSIDLMVDLIGPAAADIPSYGLWAGTIAGCEVVVSQTGFTGEKGYEIYLRDATLYAETMWNAVLEAGKAHGLAVIAPAHHRRVAAGILSWGQDMDVETLPFQVNLGYQVPRTKAGDYVGKQALETARAALEAGSPPWTHRLVGLVLGGKPIDDYAPDFWLVSSEATDDPVGYLTSPWYQPRARDQHRDGVRTDRAVGARHRAAGLAARRVRRHGRRAGRRRGRGHALQGVGQPQHPRAAPAAGARRGRVVTSPCGSRAVRAARARPALVPRGRPPTDCAARPRPLAGRRPRAPRRTGWPSARPSRPAAMAARSSSSRTRPCRRSSVPSPSTTANAAAGCSAAAGHRAARRSAPASPGRAVGVVEVGRRPLRSAVDERGDGEVAMCPGILLAGQRALSGARAPVRSPPCQRTMPRCNQLAQSSAASSTSCAHPAPTTYDAGGCAGSACSSRLRCAAAAPTAPARDRACSVTERRSWQAQRRLAEMCAAPAPPVRPSRSRACSTSCRCGCRPGARPRRERRQAAGRHQPRRALLDLGPGRVPVAVDRGRIGPGEPVCLDPGPSRAPAGSGRCSSCVRARPAWISRYRCRGPDRNSCQRLPPGDRPQTKSLRPTSRRRGHLHQPLAVLVDRSDPWILVLSRQSKNHSPGCGARDG